MNEQDRQKMKETIKRATEMNRSLLEEMENLLNENKKMEEENKKWRDYYEAGSTIYKRTQGNQATQQFNRDRSNV
ncbi:hypothetical protein CFK37_19260 [Virgibacillus phasianinus]|uniref:Uncharacterized protein n=1 Tax=Virgibacillus phasianinus TaxID=2017483 RepID=A0A220U7P3_9BACI|nr:hypothetical protein [Virgibacillus phasianinus]ASK64137.1 hypothetical protein CFK37_19260 [Virgibacillus phasianinus]